MRDALTDPRLPASRKQSIVNDLLGPRTSPVTTAAISLLVAAGHGRHLGEIASTMAELAAEAEGGVLAEVRSAIELDPGLVDRLEEAVSRVIGRRVQAKVLVDPSLLGGVVVKVGDRLFDGTIKSRFDELREQWG